MAWDEFSRTGRCVVSLCLDANVDRRIVRDLSLVAQSEAHGAALCFLAGCDRQYRDEALRLWALVRRLATTDDLLDLESRQVVLAALVSANSGRSPTRAELRRRDDAVWRASEVLADLLLQHPDWDVRNARCSRLYPERHLQDLRENLTGLTVPDVVAGYSIAPRPRPAMDFVIKNAPTVPVLLIALARQMQQRASMRMQQVKRRTRIKWNRERQLVESLAPRLLSRYPNATAPLVAELITHLANGLSRSANDPYDAILKQVQRLS